jgi:hopanoid biosynthesis associated RND transporter like protein HpnN
VLGDLDEALVRAGVIMGPSLTLAAFATAACFYSFMPTDYSGLAELGFIAGTGMIIALVLNTTMLPALLKLLSPQGEQKEIGFAWLAPMDHFLYQRRRIILVSAAVLSVFGLSLLSFLQFDADPLDLRSNKTESMATLLDLERNPQTSPNTLDVLAPSAAAAEDLARRLSQLPEVDRAMTLQSFIPDNQPQKLALIGDASLLLDTALNPFDVKPPPDMAETKASVTAVKERLGEIAGIDTTPAARSARRLAVVLGILEKGDQTIMARATAALIPSLQTLLAQLRAVLAPQPVGLNDLPANLKRDWVTSDGRARVQVFPKGNSKNHVILEKFATAVRVVAPHATGAPISTVESGRTIVHAFMVAGILSLSSIVVLLAISLRRLQDVVLTVLPLLLTGILTFASCVILDLPLNFANIIVLPLLFGFGVAFNIYYIMSWRTGGHGFLQSSLTRAVVLSALTTASGFGTLWLSSHPGTASLGELLIISLAWTLAMTLFFLPALLGSVTPR